MINESQENPCLKNHSHQRLFSHGDSLLFSFQEDLQTKEASLQEKEVVVQKLKNNLYNREGELKVREASNAKDFLLLTVPKNMITRYVELTLKLLFGALVFHGRN